MKLSFWPFNRRRVPVKPKGLRCACCGKSIHKRERFTVLSAKHRDCADAKLVGQMSLPASLARLVGPGREP